MARFARVFSFVVVGFFLVVTVSCGGCGRGDPTKSGPVRVFEISVRSFTREYRTASAFAGSVVRVRLEPGDYVVSGRELLVYGPVPWATPIVTFRLATGSPVPAAKTTVRVTGLVTRVERDGAWRSSRCDYYVTVDDCVVAGP